MVRHGRRRFARGRGGHGARPRHDGPGAHPGRGRHEAHPRSARRGSHSIAEPVRMTGTVRRAVRTWLDGLDDRERALAMFGFDDPERFTWDYRPGDRAGLALGQMSGQQRADAVGVLATALSSRGHREIEAI